MDDAFDLQRFVLAQDAAGTYDSALGELRAGRKTGHWMWFVLPQLAGLGRSTTARRYALSGADEVRAYLAHPVLGPRLRECAQVVASLPTDDPVAVLGSIDAQKPPLLDDAVRRRRPRRACVRRGAGPVVRRAR